MFKVSFNIFALEIICQRIFNKKGILRNLHSIETKHLQGILISNYSVVSYALKLSHAKAKSFKILQIKALKNGITEIMFKPHTGTCISHTMANQ